MMILVIFKINIETSTQSSSVSGQALQVKIVEF